MSDTFRKAYRELTNDETLHVAMIKRAAEGLEELIGQTSRMCPRPLGEIGRDWSQQQREAGQALAYLEMAVMWAVKAAT